MTSCAVAKCTAWMCPSNQAAILQVKHIIANNKGLRDTLHHSVVIVLCTKLDAVIDWQQSTDDCRQHLATIDVRSRNYSSEVWEKLQCKLRWGLEILDFPICMINILQLQGALFPRTQALNPVKAWPQTMCIGMKSRACNDCIDLLPWTK